MSILSPAGSFFSHLCLGNVQQSFLKDRATIMQLESKSGFLPCLPKGGLSRSEAPFNARIPEGLHCRVGVVNRSRLPLRLSLS